MDVITPTLSEIRGSTWEPSSLPATLGRLDSWVLALGFPHRYKDESSSIFSGFAGLLAVLLVIAVLCVLWNWNKWKKRRGPYLRVTVMPLRTLPRPRQRAKNIYNFLPRRQEELGRHQSRCTRIFSTESLLSRNSDSPPSAYMPSPASNALQVHRTHTHAVGYAVGIYDNAMRPQMCGNLTLSAHHVNVGASGDCTSISSQDSRDYVNVPTAEEFAETLASNNTLPKNLFVLSSAQEMKFTEEGDKGCGNASDCTSFWSPGTESNDPLTDEEGSSQTSNDYVNMDGLDLRAIQEKHPWVSVQCCREYENVPPTYLNGSQQQAEKVTPSNIDHVESRTDGLETHVQLVMQSGRSLDLGDYVIYEPSSQSENSQMKHEEEMSNKDSNDYENMLATNLGGRGSEQGPDTQLLPDELRPSHPAGTLHGVIYPARSKATTGLLVKTHGYPRISADSLG
ncbi:PREDICTED: lymphocyte transmembrane adapter 1 isoform X2 [Hipposideros armiger]|uniref:Lymphocyte transmembrane adapter 1 isoform X2 n=1 Tax=Hipposideros armiger TaxID=186990 RepID=A0A8B7RW30_HIPAR|nr:PREDICTED: lymphocyte transmembrane adapter 1 isoform X2 [Hipposideros armiger]